jgi:hypothetical protein
MRPFSLPVFSKLTIKVFGKNEILSVAMVVKKNTSVNRKIIKLSEIK